MREVFPMNIIAKSERNKRLKRDLANVLTRGKLVYAERLLKQAAKLIRIAYKELTP